MRVAEIVEVLRICSIREKKIGSRRRSKARKRLARHERKIRNQREDHQHKVSKRVIDENQVVAAESLKIIGSFRLNVSMV